MGFQRLMPIPLVRVTWMVLILFTSKTAPCMDLYLVMNSAIGVFPPLANIKPQTVLRSAEDRWENVHNLAMIGVLGSVSKGSHRIQEPHRSARLVDDHDGPDDFGDADDTNEYDLDDGGQENGQDDGGAMT